MKLLITILIGGLTNASLAAGRLMLPIIALGMGANTLLVGVISALFTAIPMVFSVSFGRWVDRVGTLIPIVFAGGLVAVSGLIFFAVQSPHALLPVAGLVGTGAVFAHVAATKAVSGPIGHSQRARNIGLLIASYSVFQFIGPLVAGVSYEQFGATVALATISGFSVLALAAVGFQFHYYKSEPPQPQHRSENGGARELLAIPPLRKWIIVAGIFSAAQILYPFVISLHSLDVGLKASQAGLLLGTFALGALTSRLSVSIVMRHAQPHIIAAVALLVGAVGYALIPFARDMHVLIALSALIGLPLGIGVPVSLNLIYDAAPEGRVSESMGLCAAFTNVMQTAAPLTLGVVASGAGVAAMVWTLGAILVASSVFSGARPKP